MYQYILSDLVAALQNIDLGIVELNNNINNLTEQVEKLGEK